jgi:molecular chaperone GrpE
MSKHNNSSEHTNINGSGGETGNSHETISENPRDFQTEDGEKNRTETLAEALAESIGEVPAPGVPEANEAAPGAEAVNWEQKSAELEAKLADLNDQYLRKVADFENFRKRMNREKQEIIEFSNQNLILDLLPVIDDFERAIKSAETSSDFTSFHEGITMIEKRLSAQLENKWGLKRFDSEGQPFDPNRHEALQMEKAAGIEEAVVKDDFVKGYLLKDRVIRFAKVKVLMPEDEGTKNNK